MKINEINPSSRVDEGLGSALDTASRGLFGDYATSAIKGMFTGRGTKEQLTYDLFFKDFYNDALASLTNGIQSGVVDPSLEMSPDGEDSVPADDAGPSAGGTSASSEVPPETIKPAPGEPGAPAATTPPSPSTPTSTSTPTPPPAGKPTSATAGAVAAQKAQQQTSQNINNYVKQAAQQINKSTDKNQKIAITKELVNAMADRKGTPEWNNAVKGVEGILRRAGTDPSFANAAINNLKAGKTMSEAWRIYFANKLVEAVGLTWKDLGLCVLKEGKNYYIAESKFVKLNNLFESIMEVTSGGPGFGGGTSGPAPTIRRATAPTQQNVNLPTNAGVTAPTVPQAQQPEAQPAQARDAKSIGEYMLDWFTAYMGGTNWTSYRPSIIKIVKSIEDSYGSDKGKTGIKTLAKAAYSIPGADGAKGAQNAKPKDGEEPKQPTGNFGAAGFDSPEAKGTSDLANQLELLRKNNPEEFKKYMASQK